MVAAIQINLSEELRAQAEQLIADGWATDMDTLVGEALRRYLASHGPALTEKFVREDVAWGLHGKD